MMKLIRHMVLAISLVGAGFTGLSASAAQTANEMPVSTFSPRAGYTTTPNHQVQRPHQYAQQQSQQQSRRRISASQAKSIAMSRVRGARFINVQMVGGDTYRVRLQQKNGRIVDVYVDARTGRVKN